MTSDCFFSKYLKGIISVKETHHVVGCHLPDLTVPKLGFVTGRGRVKKFLCSRSPEVTTFARTIRFGEYLPWNHSTSNL